MPDPVVVRIPGRFYGHTMTRVTRQIVDAATDGKLSPRVCFDFAGLNFIEPAGLVFLSNLIEWLREKGCEVSFSGFNRNAAVITYLDGCGFFAAHNDAPIDPYAYPRATTMPYTKVAQPDSHAWLDGRFIPWLSGRLDQTPATLAPLRTCTSELLNNIADHTRFNIGGIAAQHFPNKNLLGIAIADFGLGIPKSVGNVRSGLTDAAAIIQATEEGFTTQSTPRNRGAGLDYLLRVIPGAGLGTISIYSGHGIVSFAPTDGGGYVATPSQEEGYCPGTFIQIDIRTDRIQPAENEEDFEW